MSIYTVEIPIVGSMTCEVEAESKKEAVEKAWALFDETGSDNFEVTWEAVSSVTNGNVCHAPCNEVSVSRHKETP